MSSAVLALTVALFARNRLSPELARVARGARGANDALKNLNRRNAEINVALKRVESWRKLRGELDASRASMQQARDRAAELLRQIKATEKPTRRLRQEFDAARWATQRSEKAFEGKRQQLVRLRQQLVEAGVDVRRLAADERRLQDNLAATTRAIDQQNRISALRASGNQIAQAGAAADAAAASGASRLAAAAAMAAPGLASMQSAMQFEKELTQLRGLAGIARGSAEAVAIERQINTLAPLVGQMPIDVLRTVRALMAMGASAKDALAQVEPIAKTATAWDADMMDVAKASYALANNLKIASAEQMRALDAMAEAGRRGNFELRDMAQHFPALTAAYQGLGQTGVRAAAELAAALQVTVDTAGDAAQGANNLFNLLTKMSAPETIKNFAKFGIDLPAHLKKAQKEGRSVLDVFMALVRQATRGDQMKLGFLLGDQQAQSAARALLQGEAKMKLIREAALGASGLTQKQFKDVAQDANTQMASFQARWETFKAAVGAKLMPVLNQLLPMLTRIVMAVGDWIKNNPTLVSWLIKGAVALLAMKGVLAALSFLWGSIAGPIITVVGWVNKLRIGIALLRTLNFAAAGARFMGFVGTLRKGFGLVRGLLVALRVAALTNPVTAILMGLATVALLIWANWDKIGPVFDRAWASIKAVWDRFKNSSWGELGSAIIDGIVAAITGNLSKLGDAVLRAASHAKTIFKNALGIRSPSRVFMAMGGHLMTGLARGIALHAGLPAQQIARVATRVTAAAAIPLIAAPAGAAPAAGRTPTAAATGMSVTININGANASPDAIAAAVRRELAAMQRRQRAAAGSAYGDAD